MSRLECRCQLRYPSGFTLDANFATEKLVTALFGPSGAGKTSLLECIAGLRTPQEGTIRLGEQLLFDQQTKLNLPVQQRQIGVVFQEHRLFPHLSVRANLTFGQRRQVHRKLTLEQVSRVLELEPLLDRAPSQLSGGQKQRVALGRALLSGPELLLMDEPLAALDDELKERILNYLERAVTEWQIPVLLVTHSQREVQRLAEWVVVVDQGRTVATGPPAEVLTSQAMLSGSKPAGLTNLLRLAEVGLHEGHLRAKVGTQWLWLPPWEAGAPWPEFAECDPGAVVLAKSDAAQVSARNHLPGVVRQVTQVPQGTYAAIDVGQILWALVTPAAAAELELTPGREVTCLLKTHSLRLVP